MTNWDEAVSLICPRCTASNRAGAKNVELHDTRLLVCHACGYAFVVRQPDPPLREDTIRDEKDRALDRLHQDESEP